MAGMAEKTGGGPSGSGRRRLMSILLYKEAAALKMPGTAANLGLWSEKFFHTWQPKAGKWEAEKGLWIKDMASRTAGDKALLEEAQGRRSNSYIYHRGRLFYRQRPGTPHRGGLFMASYLGRTLFAGKQCQRSCAGLCGGMVGDRGAGAAAYLWRGGEKRNTRAAIGTSRNSWFGCLS